MIASALLKNIHSMGSSRSLNARSYQNIHPFSFFIFPYFLWKPAVIFKNSTRLTQNASMLSGKFKLFVTLCSFFGLMSSVISSSMDNLGIYPIGWWNRFTKGSTSVKKAKNYDTLLLLLLPRFRAVGSLCWIRSYRAMFGLLFLPIPRFLFVWDVLQRLLEVLLLLDIVLLMLARPSEVSG